jgi:hypothetical protein
MGREWVWVGWPLLDEWSVYLAWRFCFNGGTGENLESVLKSRALGLPGRFCGVCTYDTFLFSIRWPVSTRSNTPLLHSLATLRGDYVRSFIALLHICTFNTFTRWTTEMDDGTSYSGCRGRLGWVGKREWDEEQMMIMDDDS